MKVARLRKAYVAAELSGTLRLKARVRHSVATAAWREGLGKPAITVPSRRERYDLWLRGRCFSDSTPFHVVNQDNTLHTVPYRPDRRSRLFQALRARLPSYSPSGTTRQH